MAEKALSSVKEDDKVNTGSWVKLSLSLSRYLFLESLVKLSFSITNHLSMPPPPSEPIFRKSNQLSLETPSNSGSLPSSRALPFSLAMAAVRLLFLLFFSLLPLSLSLSESQALLKLKESINNSDALNSWNSDSFPCSAKWTGIICNNGIITGLHLSDLGLSGEIDIDAIRELRGLRTVSLVNNSFSGRIPEFNRVGALKALYLTSNEFSGEIRTDFFANLTSLKKVWFSGNNFSGNIPDSLGQLSHLIELHLESNQFSGEIPTLKQKTITSLDLSDNKLEGEIPSSFSRFNSKSFEKNERLCGKPLNKTCEEKKEAVIPSTMAARSPEKTSNLTQVVVVGVIAAALVFLSYLAVSSSKRRDDDFGVLGKENTNDVVEAHLPSSHHKSKESSRRGDSKRGSQHSRNGMGDLVVINSEKGPFGLADLMKAAAEVLGNGGLGSAYKAVMSNGLSVVVKRMREVNRIGKDGFDVEMRRFGRLHHRNILTPLAYHYRREEKLLVSEYVPKGSLLYVLHGDRGVCHSDLNWRTRLKIIKGIGQGMGFIHSEYSTYDLPHGNLKSSNVLLSEDYEPLLNDYALHPLINPANAEQAMFAYKSPEYSEYQEISPKSDVYCLGIIILEILTGKFPAQYLSNGKGGTDVVQWTSSALSEKREIEAIDPEIAGDADSNSVNQMVQLLRVGVSCTEGSPHQRPEMREAIRRIEEIQV